MRSAWRYCVLAAFAGCGVATQAMPASKPAAPTASSAAASAVVDINHANLNALKTLPGIGEAEAQRIVAGRPYLTKADLVSKKVLSEGPYLAIRRHIIAKQNPSKSPAKQKA